MASFGDTVPDEYSDAEFRDGKGGEAGGGYWDRGYSLDFYGLTGRRYDIPEPSVKQSGEKWIDEVTVASPLNSFKGLTY